MAGPYSATDGQLSRDASPPEQQTPPARARVQIYRGVIFGDLAGYGSHFEFRMEYSSFLGRTIRFNAKISGPLYWQSRAYRYG